MMTGTDNSDLVCAREVGDSVGAPVGKDALLGRREFVAGAEGVLSVGSCEVGASDGAAEGANDDCSSLEAVSTRSIGK
jgi:hypothetical protein